MLPMEVLPARHALSASSFLPELQPVFPAPFSVMLPHFTRLFHVLQIIIIIWTLVVNLKISLDFIPPTSGRHLLVRLSTHCRPGGQSE